MKPEMIVILGIFSAFVLLEILFTHFFRKSGQRPKDGAVELISTATLTLLTQPLVLVGGGLLAALLVPQYEGALRDSPIWLHIVLLLVFDDMMQYWWHRYTHRTPGLYALHRPHHDAAYMSIRIVYRNNVFYYLLMPALWCSGVLIYLGLGYTYAFYIVVKMLVICGAHSDLRWDRRLYEVPWLSPLMWLVERTISTPATHYAHHGKHADDGVTHYKGNYGNLLFFWDVLFGTAKITRRYPQRFGVENLEDVTAAQQLFWPLVPQTSSQRQSRTTSD